MTEAPQSGVSAYGKPPKTDTSSTGVVSRARASAWRADIGPASVRMLKLPSRRPVVRIAPSGRISPATARSSKPSTRAAVSRMSTCG